MTPPAVPRSSVARWLCPAGPCLVLAMLVLAPASGRAQIPGAAPVAAAAPVPGTLDKSYNPNTGVNGFIVAVAAQPDGKVIVGGGFTSIAGVPRNRVARLSADGSLDETFNPGTGVEKVVRAVALQPDGKVIVGGEFTQFNGVPRTNVVRLNTDGSLDPSFNAGPMNYAIFTVAVQPDGNVLIGGSFTEINGVPRLRVARLNASGGVDATFDPGTGASASVRSLTALPDGKILVAGNFPKFNGAERTNIARLNANGSVDAGFNAGKGPDQPAETVAVQPDGKVLIGGYFKTVNGVERRGVARLNVDGGVDPDFVPKGVVPYQVRALALQPDGKVILVGRGNQKIFRLNPDGSEDAGFVVQDTHRVINPMKENHSGIDGSFIGAVALQPGGKMLVTGDFSLIDKAPAVGVARLNADGSLNSRFNAGGTGANKAVLAAALQPDGKVILGGEFTAVNGAGYNHIVRVNPDGSVDPAFDPGEGADADVRAVLLQPDGKVIIGGNFEKVNGVQRRGVARLNANGSVDTSFFPGEGAAGPTDDVVDCLTWQGDGKIIVAGNIGTMNKINCSGIARLNANGTVDQSFHFSGPFGYRVQAVAVQPDGKMVLGGCFSKDGKPPLGLLVRVSPNGTLDTTFNAGVEPDKRIVALALQTDGRIVVGGQFTRVGTMLCPGLARVNADGKADFRFSPGLGTVRRSDVRSLALLADGKILVGGDFDPANGAAHGSPARLNADGTLDPAFAPGGGGTNNGVCAIVVQPDGKLIIVGNFAYVLDAQSHGTDRNGFARLHGEVAPARLPRR